MSPGEIGWRIGGVVQNSVDRWRVASRTYPGVKDAVPGSPGEPPFRLTDVPVGAATRRAIGEPAFAALIRAADDILHHRLTFFALERQHLGDPIDWNRDHECGKATPTGFAQSIDYRDHRVAGDAKVVWEPNRHHHLVVLGRAYRATGDRRYADGVAEQLASWLDQCPYGTGMQWRSPLELGVRLINWTWTLDLIRESQAITGPLRDRVLHAIYLQLWEVTRKFSRASSANNHLIGEAAGVFVASTYLPDLARSFEWSEASRNILVEQIQTQTFADGANCEHAFGYHLFVLHLFLHAGIAARRSGRDFPAEYWAVVEKMIGYASALAEAGPAPMYGDADDAYVLDLGARIGDVDALRGIGAILFDRADLKALSPRFREPSWWLFGAAGRQHFEQEPLVPVAPLKSRAFQRAGYYLLQSGSVEHDDQLSVFVDCAELGFGAIAAHGHADALAVTVRAFGRDVLVDPGTYDYFTYPEWRTYLRSTRAHNTVEIDGRDQSAMLGPFMWGARAAAKCLSWSPADDGGAVSAEHDGYHRLDDPVTHRRTVALAGRARTVTITDQLAMRESHVIRLHFHFAEGCTVLERDRDGFLLAIDDMRIRLTLDERLTAKAVAGAAHGDAPGPGWVSRGYHRKSPGLSIVAEATLGDSAAIVSTMTINRG
jgi:hypothetical protein